MAIVAAWVLRLVSVECARMGARPGPESFPWVDAWVGLNDAADEYDGGADGGPWWAWSEVSA